MSSRGGRSSFFSFVVVPPQASFQAALAFKDEIRSSKDSEGESSSEEVAIEILGASLSDFSANIVEEIRKSNLFRVAQAALREMRERIGQ